MKIIYLWVNNEGWTSFDFDNCKEELTKRSISIGVGARIGVGATIGYGARIGVGARIGDGATIGVEATIGDGATIGDRATIGVGARIGDRATIGSRATIVKSLFITGSKHSVIWYGTGIIHIGCHQRTIEEWLDVYANVGEDESYTSEEIDEYLGYIRICEMMQKTIAEPIAEAK